MKISLITIIFSLLLSCGSSQSSSDQNTNPPTKTRSTSIDPVKNKVKEPSELNLIKDYAKEYAETITQEDLKKVLYTLASDEYEGRFTGEEGQKKAAKYISDYYKGLNIAAANSDGNYLQTIPKDYFRGSAKNDSENVVAFIKGSEKPDEYIVLSAHYDHVGIKGGKIYNGADDDASGNSAILEIAEAFQQAVKEGNGPKRSIVFLHVTGEEIGLYGSKYYTENPIFPLENTVANLNIDMVGRVDKKHAENPEFVYLIGADKLSTELHELSEATNKKYTNLELDYTFNDENDPNRFYYRSDHYNFAKNNIPIIFYFNGVHEDYHKHSDTPDKIRYDLLQKRAQLVFYTVWEIANRDKRLVVDKK
ncbi:M28 family metallopeptidase [Aureibaculum sp. 2210JD6-5]|uniref:M28 family metallopeptidase n=1 Tax=Aureibaculum sp. 2210JD6-5 TaxID=3103957 RepID=UPI002AADA15D|nr:M28 family metallopeptidase [Aureibaculum sp. 2210JD6-5]MDY7394222.1 M28 family metallopeptidase [Aureibaculum sp. 2210JD6-5]